jgi:hypothetical protein
VLSCPSSLQRSPAIPLGCRPLPRSPVIGEFAPDPGRVGAEVGPLQLPRRPSDRSTSPTPEGPSPPLQSPRRLPWPRPDPHMRIPGYFVHPFLLISYSDSGGFHTPRRGSVSLERRRSAEGGIRTRDPHRRARCWFRPFGSDPSEVRLSPGRPPPIRRTVELSTTACAAFQSDG